MEFLPTYQAVKKSSPLLASQLSFIEKSRQTVRNILNGLDPRLLLIVGPCSIHDHPSALEFAAQLHQLSLAVSSQFFMVMRVYCEKPRTACGWKGFLYDPFLDGSHAMHLGIERSRHLLLELANMQVPAATEFLDPLTAFYYDDLITWGSIGARTASSQIHRQLASGLEMPIGFKNGIAGNISAAINGSLTARLPHTYMSLSETGNPILKKTLGNPDTHIVLRGGEKGPNFDPFSVSEALLGLEKANLPTNLLIDCSHHNSGKKWENQPLVFQSVIHQMIEGNNNIKGLMLESHLYGGRQILTENPSQLKYGVSITDECLDWLSTTHLIKWGVEHLNKKLPLPQPEIYATPQFVSSP